MLMAACGSDGDGGATASSDGAEAAVAVLIERHYAHPSCDDLTSAGREAFGHPTDDDACASDIAHQATQDVTVTDVEVDGSHATAVAEGFRFDLVLVDGEWLIDGGSGA